MNKKNVLGLDLGTNSIGWALIKLPENYEAYGTSGEIVNLGARILPDTDYKKAFEVGQTKSDNVKTPAAIRREKRGSRRLKHRYKLRRTRLVKVFKALGWITKDFPEDFKEISKYDESFNFHISNFLHISDDTYRKFYKDFGYNDEEVEKIINEIKYRRKHHKKNNTDIKLLPEDWIVYYLRKKALSEKIEISELGRIIYMLNQRRGFKSSRKDLKESYVLPYEDFIRRKDAGEYGEDGIETKFVTITKVKDVEQITSEPDKKGKYKFKITLEDERVEPYEIYYKIKELGKNENSDKTLENEKEKQQGPKYWIGKEFTFLVTQKVDKNGKFSQNKPQIPDKDNWELCTTALDEKIEQSQTQHPGAYFYDELVKAYKEKRNFKIRQYPVYRWRYQKEFESIWKKQCELNSELKQLNTNKDVLKQLAEILYPTQSKYNLPKLNEFLSHDLYHIIANDIIYYQRELKSQKNLISECRYEKRRGIEKNEKGEFIHTGTYGLKCIPKSSPLFQEFRIWQDIHNIRILKREEIVDGKTRLDVDYTKKYMTDAVKEALFELFDSKATVLEVDILNLIKEKIPENDITISKNKETPHSHRINLYANRDSLKGNELKARYRAVFEKAGFDEKDLLNNQEDLFKIWHADYSITSSDEDKSRKGITTALSKILPDQPNKDKFIEAFIKLRELKKEYGAYSAKAIKKLLPLMRTGKYWKYCSIDEGTKQRIEKIINGEFDENINNETREKINTWTKQNRNLQSIEDFRGLPTWLACYVVYGVHSENEIVECKNAEEFHNKVILKLKNNSLRNPVAEEVVRETLLIVRDLWKVLEKKGEKIDEIHIELGRELKNNSEEKKRIADVQKRNFEEKIRIKKLLKELINEPFEHYNQNGEIINEGFNIKPNPENPNDIEKFRIYKTCASIDLNENQDKWDALFKDGKKEREPTKSEIKKYILWLSQHCRSPYTGKIIPLSKLFDPNQYEIEHIIPRAKLKNDSINNLIICEWGVNKAKGNQLAANFISSCNGKCKYGDTEYTLLTYEEYVKYVKDTFKLNKAKQKNLLATEPPNDFVERQINDTRFITKKVAELLKPVVGIETKILFTGGAITAELRKYWGLTKVWKTLMRPRFERLEKLKGESYIKINEQDPNDFDFYVPENEQLDIKRIDHRHHALDALVVAATTREHIRYLNSLNAVDSSEELKKIQRSLVKGKIRDFKLPWESFTKDAREKLEATIISFKVKKRIISKPRNIYTKWQIINDKPEKVKIQQQPNNRWMAIRKSLFKEPLGVVWLKDIKEVNVLKAFEIEIERQQKANNPVARKTSPYIYDKDARQIIKDILSKCNSSIENKDEITNEIKKFLEEKKTQNGTYLLNGKEYSKINIAEFKSYKTKRMSIGKKEYMEKLDLKKMINDFPYFKWIHTEQYNQFNDEQKLLISNSGIKVSDTKKMNPVNFLFLQHILEYNNNPKEAFSQEGIDYLNRKAIEKIGKEIKTITRLDGEVNIEDIFRGGYYEPDKGAMAYFVIYENEKTKEREDFISIPTHKAIEKIIQRKPIAEDRNGYRKIILSPGDLVYVPAENTPTDLHQNKLDPKRIFIVNDFTGSTCYFKPIFVAQAIIPKEVDLKKENNKLSGSFDTKTASFEGSQVKNTCVKISVNRLGNISFK